MNTVLKLLNMNVRNILINHLKFFDNKIYEIRLRINNPVFVKSVYGDYFLNIKDMSKNYNDDYYKIRKKDVDETVTSLTLNSIHAFEKEIKNGYITIEGGHRVGIGGDCIYDGDNFKGFKNITSLNIRIAKEFRNCSLNYLKNIIGLNQKVYNTLIIGPPMSGKTTLIRDISAHISDGMDKLNFKGSDVTVIDERGEISAVYNGIPQMYLGRRTDILAYCMKKEGFFMSIRSLSPGVIICDELGSKEDFEIIQYALKSGVYVIATAHGYDLNDVRKNIYLKNMIESNFFERAIILKSSKTPSLVKEIIDIPRNKVICDDAS